MSGIFPSGGVGPSQALPTNLPTIDTIGTNCTTLYHNARCNTRVDPASVNALIAEVGTAVNGAGRDYDCSRYDNLLLAMRDLSSDVIFGCLTENFPSASGACSIEYLALVTDEEGCRKIARYTESNALLGRVGNSSVWGLIYPLTAHPTTPTNPATFYALQALATDINNNSVNYSKLNNNRLATMAINVPCDNSRIRLEVNQSVQFNPALNSGNGGQSAIVVRIDGVFPLTPGGLPLNFGAITNFEGQYNAELSVVLDEGPHTIDVYVAAYTGFPSQIYIQGSPVTSGITLSAYIDVA